MNSIAGKYYRGCMSESSEGKHLCETDKFNCHLCSEFGCNNIITNNSTVIKGSWSVILMTLASLPPLIR